MTKDSYGMTPLLAAAVTGHVPVVEYLIGRSECDKPTSIDALELLGATFVDKKRDMAGALKFWRRAMFMRHSIPYNKVVKRLPEVRVPAYGDAVEVTTMDQLENLITDPDDMRMQALLVRERILGPAHPDTTYYIRYRGAVYADMGNFERCVSLWMYALNMQQKMLEPLSPMTQSSLLSFAELFSFMMTDTRNRQAHPVAFTDMMEVFQKCIHEIKLGQSSIMQKDVTEKDIASYNRLVLIAIHILCLLCKIRLRITEEEGKQLNEVVYELVKMNPRNTQGKTLLHLSCSNETTTVGRYPVCKFPSPDVVEILLDLGARCDIMDENGDLPLHIAAKNSPVEVSVIETLLRGDAHIDTMNKDRKCLEDLLTESDVTLNPVPYQNLQCLCAKTIMKSSVPFKGLVPKRIEPFIEMH